MTASSGIQADTTTPGSEFVDNFLAYYSDGATKATPSASSLCMRPKSYESSAQSTDSEHTGAVSSESTSSLGDSATAAARVLAAWQDRAGESPGSAVAVSIGDSSALWSAQHRHSDLKVQSSTSTPRLSRSAFDAQTREGSAPVAGSVEAGQRRADMSFLALLNSAAAYVAESSNNPAPGQQEPQNAQHGADSFGGRSELLSSASLALSNINADFDQSRGEEHAGFQPHYGAPFQDSSVYQDFAQVLRHMTSANSESGLAAGSADIADQPQFSAPSFVSNPIAAAAVHPGQVMAGNDGAMHFGVASQSSAMAAPAMATPAPAKRKRKDSSQTQQSPNRRKTSHASDRDKTTQSELRRAARKWTEDETENLLQGCSKYGVGAWKKILDDPNFSFNNRTSVDLKDRFRTIRAQECAHSPYAKSSRKGSAKEPDVVWPLPPNSQRLQGLQRVQRKPTRNYTSDEDRRLLIGVLRHANHWTKIAADPDLKLGDRPGQSLRDRLRNAFPEVFELFGYVIPKKERADRERCPTPTVQTAEKASAKRKAPTGSKRLEGEIPEHIRDKITTILHNMNASLDPRPILEFGVDAELETAGSASASPGANGQSSGLASMDVSVKNEGSITSQSSRRQSTAASMSNTPEQSFGHSTAASRGGRGRRRASTRRTRSTSKAAPAAYIQHDAPMAAAAGNDMHSAPVHANSANFGQLGDITYSDAEHRRSGTASAGALAAQRNLLFESFSPSVFSRPLGTMTPTDQLDALALEGRMASGYSTPTQSTKRRHSVQADINDALAAAALAAGIDRSNFASALQFFHPGMNSLDHTPGATGMPLNTADSIRRMTVAGPIGADPFIFPRLPDEEANADMSHMSSTQNSERPVQANGAHSAGLTATSEATITPHAHSTDAFKFSSAIDASALSTGMIGHHIDDSYAVHRSQMRSAGRLLRANGVADDNSIGLSTTSNDSRVDMEALTQFSQWFPSLASGSINWNMGSNANTGDNTNAGASQLCNESIDPNMLDAGLGTAATMVASASDGTGSILAIDTTNGLDMGHESNMTHARRRSQFDWYGLTPSLAAALDAAGTTAVAAAQAAVSESSELAPLAPFSVGHSAAQGSYRRPSMPIFPSFAYAQGNDMLNMPSVMHTDEIHGAMPTTEPLSYGDTHDGSGIAAAAAAAAAAVAVALSDSESLSIHASEPTQPGHGMRSYSMGAGSAITSNALAKLAGINGPHMTSAARPRVADVPHNRRRSMHVPPSLVEGVASAGFSAQGAPRVFPYPPRPTNASHLGVQGPRARRSRSTSNQNTHMQNPTAMAQLPAVSETHVLPTQFPTLPTTETEQTLDAGPNDAGHGMGLRHARTYSGTQFSQDALSALAGVSPGLLTGAGFDHSHFDLAAGFAPNDARTTSSGSMDIDLEAMTSLSTSGMELSFKPLWTDDTHIETRSLADIRADLAANMVDLYRPASSTPTNRYLGIVGSGSARNASPIMVAQSTSAVSPVAPRSAASTPGRREAVGF
ncbi:hypothetical protein IW147_003110 [Coemansia sp. RSA 720]|nr:hypothetical protein IW147_003110 [Coemansia sp. RSA 720]